VSMISPSQSDSSKSPIPVSSTSRHPLRERIITPHGGLDAFREAWRSIIQDFPQSRSLGWRLFVRDTMATYRQSLLGYFWIMLPPLATAFIWIFLSSQQLVTMDTGGVPVPMFVLTGTILWTAFNMAVIGMQAIMSEARSVLSKVNFPHEALVISAFFKTLLNTTVPALTLLPAMVAFGIPIEPHVVLFPIAFVTLILLGCSIGLLLVPLSALYSDISRAVQLALRFGFFATPVIYALPTTGSLRTLMLCNPVAAPLVSGRHWMIGGGEALWLPTMAIVAISFVVLVIATLVFKVTMPHIIERLNS
jgi:lipopolysaccharide transport system permease protein